MVSKAISKVKKRKVKCKVKKFLKIPKMICKFLVAIMMKPKAYVLIVDG